MSDTKICKSCGLEKTLDYYLSNNSSSTRRNLFCKKCNQGISNKRISLFHKKGRIDPKQRAKYIVSDSKKYDAKNNLNGFDLDINFVQSLIKDGCSYCLSTNSFMTIDRIDNSICHRKNNVVACCYRCNLIRRDMPWGAWCRLLPKIQEIQEKGLFGNWYDKAVARK